jgi:hypothetical protein
LTCPTRTQALLRKTMADGTTRELEKEVFQSGSALPVPPSWSARDRALRPHTKNGLSRSRPIPTARDQATISRWFQPALPVQPGEQASEASAGHGEGAPRHTVGTPAQRPLLSAPAPWPGPPRTHPHAAVRSSSHQWPARSDGQTRTCLVHDHPLAGKASATSPGPRLA